MTARGPACAATVEHTATTAKARQRRTITNLPVPAPAQPLRNAIQRSAQSIRNRTITRYSIRGEAALHCGIASGQLTQDVLQDAPVLEVIKLVEGIDAADQRDALEAAVGGDDLGDHALAWLDLAMQPANGDLLVALEPERLPGCPFLEAQRQHAHADQVRAMDALERLRHDRAHAKQVRPFRRPIARRSAAVFLAGEDNERHLVGLVAHGGVENRHAVTRRKVDRKAALYARQHLVLEADVGESAA